METQNRIWGAILRAGDEVGVGVDGKVGGGGVLGRMWTQRVLKWVWILPPPPAPH